MASSAISASRVGTATGLNGMRSFGDEEEMANNNLNSQKPSLDF